MKKIFYFLITFPFVTGVWAGTSLEPILNKVTLQLQMEQWLTTKSALVNVSINAAVSDQGIVGMQNQIMKKLSDLSNQGEWHIISFNRQLDKSGLESMQMMAQARLPQTELGNLRDKAKTMSKPGETYTIDNVQFTPSEDEIRQAKLLLRNNIYSQAKAEIDTLNKTYTDQKYYLHQIDFMMITPMAAQPMAMIAQDGNGFNKMGGGGPLSIGNKLNVQATVVLASMPDNLLKLTNNNAKSSN